MSLTDELQKRRIPASVFKMINDHQIGSVAELAARSDLLKCFESELKPIQWCKLKNMIKDFQGQATHTVSQQNTDNIDVDDNQNREAVLIETEMKASKEDLSEQFHCECEYLKGVISMILDDISCVNEQVRAILERSKEAHQRRATRLKQLLLDVHKFTPDALDGNKGRVKQLSVSHINSARKEFVRENNLRVHIKELVVAETSEPSEIAAALKVERKHLSRDVSVTKERHADCPQPEPGIFAMLSSVLWGRPADRATTREASSPPESPRLKAPLCAEHIVKRGRQPTTVAQKGMKTVPISVSGEKETPPANDLICADTCWQSHLHGAPEPQPSTLHYASDRGDALFTQNNRCRVSTSNSMSMGAGSWSGSGTGEDNGKVEENPSPLRPNVLQSLQDLTAETDKFTLCMGALNMGSPAELAPPAPDETATATTTVPPIDPSALRTVATDLHVSFYELVHQLVLLCEEVHSYNVYLERIKRTRELLNARYMSLPRVSLMACYIYSNATYAYREAKKAELDAHQADLMAREAALSGMWDDLHNRCYQWNGAAHHFNSAWGQVNDECIRWNTGLTLVGDTIPLPELYMSDSVSHFSPGLFLFAAKDTLVVPFNRGKVCDYWFIVWNHFRRITGTYR